MESHIRRSSNIKYFDTQVLYYDAEGMITTSVFAMLCTSASILRRSSLLRDLLIIFMIPMILSPTMRVLIVTAPTEDELNLVVTLISNFHGLLTSRSWFTPILGCNFSTFVKFCATSA